MLGEYGIAAGAQVPSGSGGGFAPTWLSGDPTYLAGAGILLVLAIVYFLAR